MLAITSLPQLPQMLTATAHFVQEIITNKRKTTETKYAARKIKCGVKICKDVPARMGKKTKATVAPEIVQPESTTMASVLMVTVFAAL